MIVRGYIKCSTCEHPHMPRVQVGRKPEQIHSFNCLNCKEPIKLNLKINEKTLGAAIVAIENCELIPQTDCTPIYLSGDFVANPADIHSEWSFPSAQFITTLAKSPDAIRRLTSSIPNKSHDIEDDWKLIQKIWRLENANKHEVAKQLLKNYSSEHEVNATSINEALWFFLNSLFPFKDKLRNEVKEILHKNKPEFIQFLNFYKYSLKSVHRQSLLNLLSEFYDQYDQHSQLFPYIRIDSPIEKIGKATLIDFKSVKSFYANAYEYFAGAICIYTCLNNIKEGRPYDKLKSITLHKYLETDKAKRRDSLLNNSLFSELTKEFDSNIRNASFHNWFFLLPDNETIELRSGGTGAFKKISYTEYLYKCGLMYKQICQLFILELELEQIAKDMNLYSFNITKE